MSAAVVVGLGYPASWDVREAATKGADVMALNAMGVEVLEMFGADPERHREAFERAEVILTMYLPSDVVALAPRLRWVQAIGAGVGHLPLAALAAAGVRISNSSGLNAKPVAEFAFARLLAHLKRHRRLDDHQDTHTWRGVVGAEAAGSTLAVLGLGRIGQAVAMRAAAFDMHVIGMRRQAAPAVGIDEVYGPDRLHEVLARADAVIACLPGTAETAGLMDASAFAAMRPGAFFCNVGRGSLVDEAALIEALASGRLGGAALDVTATEPLPPDDPLWDAPNLYLSAHSASFTVSHFTRVHRLFRMNLAHYLAWQPLINELDPEQGY